MNGRYGVAWTEPWREIPQEHRSWSAIPDDWIEWSIRRAKNGAILALRSADGRVLSEFVPNYMFGAFDPWRLLFLRVRAARRRAGGPLRKC